MGTQNKTQREIKFRVWHKESREMLHAGTADIFIWQHEGQPLEIMQYTGLKDRLGCEIYEGDIVKRMDSCYAIYWHEFTACWRMTGHMGITKGDMALMCEVTGNIYENVNLLKG